MKTKNRLIGVVTTFIVSLFGCTAVLGEEPRALFNHGAELAASGEFDAATEVLHQAAVVRDRTTAAKALTLLGQIAASSARQHVAENPVETLPEDRQAIFEHLQSAEQAFIESLSLQPDDETRKYVETLRAWRHNMTNAWEEYDREQRRNTELYERIRWLADWEKELTERVRPLLEEPNSPRKFQTGYETGREQRRLAEELKWLQEIPMHDEELAEQWERLPEIQRIAEEAAALLSDHRAEEALPKQEQVFDYLWSLLPQDQQNQDQNQDENEQQQQQQEQGQGQDQHEQEQESESDSDSGDGDNGEQEQESEMEQPQSTGQDQQEGGAAQDAESPEERAERLLMQMRRKEQSARELRDQLRALLMQSDPVERDW